jgi:uncharacterized repeat protein (TIGR01451 family)
MTTGQKVLGLTFALLGLQSAGAFVGQTVLLRDTAFAASNTLVVGPDLTLQYPDTWSVAPPRFRNASELVNVPAGSHPDPGVARITITTETGADHQEAMQRLASIAAEVRSRSTYTEICGWPALERQYVAPLDIRTRPNDDRLTRDGWRVTVAVAVDERVVRLESRLPEQSPAALIQEVVAIGRSLTCGSVGGPGQVEEELDQLSSAELALTPPAAAEPLRSGEADSEVAPAAVAVPAPRRIAAGGEIEVAVSTDGQFVVVGTNGGQSFSTNGGSTFGNSTLGGLPAAYTLDGDPSLAFGVSGNFYFAKIGCPASIPMVGCAPSGTQCSTAVLRSINNGQTFNFRGNATLCDDNGTGGLPTCFPDQEHIAADRINAATGQDQVYSVWRDFFNMNCQGTAGNSRAAISCSTDGGQTFPTTVIVDTGGDFPRVTVGQDGRVYVVYTAGTNVMLQRYTSCANGLVAAFGTPRTVAAGVAANCPIPGIDRCAFQFIASPMAAVDDNNANHIYVGYATTTTTGVREDVRVQDSTDSGNTWRPAVTLNANVNGHRFMPWLCSTGGAARVSWYDQRAGAAGGANDLTDYYCGSAALNGTGNLVAGAETRVTQVADGTCASGWGTAATCVVGGAGGCCVPRAQNDSESCSVQPQLAGVCCRVALNGNRCAAGMGSGNRCDFSTAGCPPMESCQVGNGCPKYGDYSGNACAAGRVFNAWASASPAPPAVGIDTFVTAKAAAGLPTLTLTKADAPDPVLAGSNLTYTLSVTNSGPSTALNLAIADATPPNTTFVSATGTGFTCSTPFIGATGAISCTRPFLAIGGSAVLTIVVRVNDLAPDQSVLMNTATLTTVDTPAQSSNTTQTLVINQADLEASKQSPPPNGGAVTYVIASTNHGPNQADGLDIADTIPANTRFVSLDSVSAGGACSAPIPNTTGSVECTWLGFTPVNAVRSVQFTVRACEASISNAMQTSSQTVDPNSANNTASVATTVALPVSAPTITGGVHPFATVVSGRSLPDPIANDNCVHIFNCGPNRDCGTDDDVDIGMGNADADGFFSVNLVSPLPPDIDIYAKEVCCNLMGPVVHVPERAPAEAPLHGHTAPVLHPLLVGLLAALLGLGGAVMLGLRSRRPQPRGR